MRFKHPSVKVEGAWIYTDIDLRAAILGKTNGNCAYCQSKLNFMPPAKNNSTAFTVDHFVPRTLGGGNTLHNLFPVCYACNNAKGELHPEEWLSSKPFRKFLVQFNFTVEEAKKTDPRKSVAGDNNAETS